MTITPEQLDALEHRSKDDNLAKMIVGSEVRELIAEVRRLTASLAEMRECYIARTADRDRAEARVAELETKLNHESYVSDKRAQERDKAEADAYAWANRYEEIRVRTAGSYDECCAKREKAEADRAALVEAMRRLATCQCCPFNDSDIARAALAKVGEGK